MCNWCVFKLVRFNEVYRQTALNYRYVPAVNMKQNIECGRDIIGLPTWVGVRHERGGMGWHRPPNVIYVLRPSM